MSLGSVSRKCLGSVSSVSRKAAAHIALGAVDIVADVHVAITLADGLVVGFAVRTCWLPAGPRAAPVPLAMRWVVPRARQEA